MLWSSSPNCVFRIFPDLESISNNLHSFLITVTPKLEPFSYITSLEINSSSLVYSTLL